MASAWRGWIQHQLVHQAAPAVPRGCRCARVGRGAGGTVPPRRYSFHNGHERVLMNSWFGGVQSWAVAAIPTPGARRRPRSPAGLPARPAHSLAVTVAAHKATSRPMRVVEVARCRVVHGGGRSALATNRPTAAVGNPCLTRCASRASFLTSWCVLAQGVHRLPCPCGNCLRRSPSQGPGETCSPQGAGRPRRAPRCSARPSKLERLFMSFPPRLPTRAVIPQLQGVCP